MDFKEIRKYIKEEVKFPDKLPYGKFEKFLDYVERKQNQNKYQVSDIMRISDVNNKHALEIARFFCGHVDLLRPIYNYYISEQTAVFLSKDDFKECLNCNDGDTVTLSNNVVINNFSREKLNFYFTITGNVK